MSTANSIESVRRFNRFYTQRIGVLQEGLLDSPFSLTEARVIHELAHHQQTTATQLAQSLGLNAGYLSRLLRGLQKRGLLDKRPSEHDGRQYLLSLSNEGQREYKQLEAASRKEIGDLLDHLQEDDQQNLVDSMGTIESILGKPINQKVPFVLRPHQPGDMGWVINRHAVLYNREYGWTGEFEALAAEIAAQFIRNFDPKRERCWIAEVDGENVGSVFLIKKTETTAQLRMLLVEPKARGLGIGKRLVQECTRFAKQVGYNKIMLWTNSILDVARQLYLKEGYRLIKEEPHSSFGHGLIGQIWELDL